jgi:D-alanyl-D-alanine carboxypeptidase
MHSIRYRLYALAISIPLLCAAIRPANAQNIPPEIKAILEAPRYKDAIWGLRVIDLETGQPLIDLEPRHKFFIG